MTAEAILRFLADWAIRSTVLAIVVAALLSAARIKSAHLRLTAWTLVLAGALLMPLATILTPAIPIPVLQSDTRLLQASPAIRPPVLTSTAGTEASPLKKPLWPGIAITLWITIASAMLMRIAVGLWLAARLIRTSRATAGGTRESDRVRIPVTIGAIRPAVILPSDWRAWDSQKLRAVLAHEQSHVARRDPLRQLAASIYRALAWFHPLAWWLRAEIVELAEAASDDAALASNTDRATYAETLLGFIQNAPHRVSWEGVAMASPKARSRRIERILDSNRELSRPPRLGVLAALSFAAVALTCITASLHPVQASPAGQAAPGTCAAKGPFSNWMNQDVAYIINDTERAAFTKLMADAECTQFISQFWARRDPTPGTPENEYKEEHYRRIAHANLRFAASNKEGWQTDRGRTYIVYGPPDEMESHPKGTASLPYPKEAWLYHHLEGIGTNVIVEFVDKDRSGAYPMTSDPAFAAPSIDTQAESQFHSNNAGTPAVVSVTGRRMSVRIPVDFVSSQYTIVGETRSTDPSRKSRQNLGWVGTFPDGAAVTLGPITLEPGSYVVEVGVRDQDRQPQRTYTVTFKVK